MFTICDRKRFEYTIKRRIRDWFKTLWMWTKCRITRFNPNERTIIYVIFIIIYLRFLLLSVHSFARMWLVVSCVEEGVSALVMHKHTDRPLPDGIKCAIQIQLKQHNNAATKKHLNDNISITKFKKKNTYRLDIPIKWCASAVVFLSHVLVPRFDRQLSFSFSNCCRNSFSFGFIAQRLIWLFLLLITRVHQISTAYSFSIAIIQRTLTRTHKRKIALIMHRRCCCCYHTFVVGWYFFLYNSQLLKAF